MNALISRSANHILLPAIGITCLALCTLLILGGMVNAPTPAGTATPLPALTDGEGDPHEEKDKEDFMLPLPWPFFADGEGDPHEEKDKEDFVLPLPWPFQTLIG